jgi:cbb3-type cytochrome oxidase subunit 3
VVTIILLNSSNTTNESDGRYYYRNVENFMEIIGAISIIAFWSFVLGLIVSFLGLTNRSNKKFGGKENLVGNFENTERDGIDIRSYLSIALGFLILTIPGFFVSILTEFARQLLFFQLMIFFVGVIASTNKSNKKYLKANS